MDIHDRSNPAILAATDLKLEHATLDALPHGVIGELLTRASCVRLQSKS